ncbi:MAG: exosortase-associated EpsI family protein, partial [Azoarcus sp.]|nr:exosortase-associated EpsI family protein [Azoarcus sp.]
MKNRVLFRRASLLAVLMLVAAILAHTLTPTITTKAEIIDFESLVPRQFGEWRMDEAAAPGAIINPQLKETLDRIYTQTLSRTYVNREGRRIML